MAGPVRGETRLYYDHRYFGSDVTHSLKLNIYILTYRNRILYSVLFIKLSDFSVNREDTFSNDSCETGMH